MSDTMLEIVNEILRACNQVTVTAFSDLDDSNFIVDRVNDALEVVYDLGPQLIDTAGTITMTPSTRKFNGPTGVDLQRIYDYSWRINNPTNSGDVLVKQVSPQFITLAYPQFETYEANQPNFVYYEGGQVAFYPLLLTGSSNLTIQFLYP